MARPQHTLGPLRSFASLSLLPILVYVLAFSAGLVTGHPYLQDNAFWDSTVPLNGSELTLRADKVPLRILPLGASIVYGDASSNKNGFRGPLRDALRSVGWEVDMVGTRQNGQMVDNDNEGTSGAILSQIREYLQRSLGYKPNVVVINGGTNDAKGNIDPGGAGERMRLILKDIWAEKDMDRTCIMLSTIIPTPNPTGAANRKIMNRLYRQLVQEYWAVGQCIYLAEMDPERDGADNGAGWLAYPADYGDDTHPNDQGYKKMAAVFYKTIVDASNANLIVKAAPMQTTGNEGCDKKPGQGIYSGGKTQDGSGQDDGIYYHDSQEKGVLLTFDSAYDRNQWRFARLYGRKYDDLVGWIDRDGKHYFGVWKNQGGGNFKQLTGNDMYGNIFCNPAGLHFIDMNADGYDDIVCVYPNGDLELSTNNRDGTDSKPPTFTNRGVIMTPKGQPQARVRLADIDGDGRGDYCILDDGGNVHCWRNGGNQDAPEYWQALGKRFDAKGMGDMRGVRFEDINGDGRDDWLWVGDQGATTTWTNSRSCLKGREGDGLNVAWRQGFHKGADSGPTHSGMSGFGDGYYRDRIFFARIYGEAQDFGLLGRQDYVFLDHEQLSGGNHRFRMRVWKNIGGGSTKLKADGVKYCNMMGHSDGRMDYVWTHSKGNMRVYHNIGRKDVSDGKPFWGANEEIWDAEKMVGKPLSRQDLHLADWDGDGTCDIIWVDPDNNNKVGGVWLNLYPYRNKWEWTYHANPASATGIQCALKRGLGIHDLSVRFADLTGNKRADYLCIEPNGRTTGWVHLDNNKWESVGQIKFAVGADRANLRWADVNGDGKADMIWVDKWNGNAQVFYNRDRGNPAELSGSSFRWDSGQAAYEGSYAGTCQYFPDLDGGGRADLHSIMGTFTNQAETWFSASCGLTNKQGDNPGGVVNPNLPQVPWDTNPGTPDPGSPGNPGPIPNHPEPYTPTPGDDNPLSPCQGQFDSLEAIKNNAHLIAKHCGIIYVMKVLLASIQSAKSASDKIMANGYDGYFNTYADYMVGQAQSALHQFMKDRGKEFFDCDIMERIMCCPACEFEHRDCKWCLPVGECRRPESSTDDTVEWKKRAETCPPDYSQRGDGEDWEFTTYWKMKNGKEEDFYAAVLRDVGIEKEHIKWSEWSKLDAHTLSPSCARESAAGKMSESCYYRGFWNGSPYVSHDYGRGDVLNPKDTLVGVYKNAETLNFNLTMLYFMVTSGHYADEYFPADIVNTASIPVFMMEEAVTHMNKVVEMAKELEAADKKMLALMFLSWLFFILPFGGTALAGLGMTALGRAATLIGAAGDIALAIESVVADPNTAPLLVFALIMNGRGIRDAGRLARAAEIRRVMNDGDIDAFSKAMRTKLDNVGSVVSKNDRPLMCRWG